ncbi:MAG: glutamate 5-kinase [Bdellovibrionales bacterium]|nr:glutamate 5-kinase [Bdellovibrionales bacterium]
MSESSRKRWVVKVGSQLVCNGGPLLLRAWMQQVAALAKKNVEVVWVTSGAIAMAIERTGFESATRTLAEKQALSAIGQPGLMDLYNLSLNAVGLKGAQILLSYGDMADPVRGQNLERTLQTLLHWGVVPILNENDAVATEEIKFGDNDSLSAKVAVMLKADRLVLLTDVDGLYDKNPKHDPKSAIVPHLDSVSDALLEQLAPAEGSKFGTGGMYSKLKAAKEANAAGIRASLVRGDLPNVLLRLVDGECLGTSVGAKG